MTYSLAFYGESYLYIHSRSHIFLESHCKPSSFGARTCEQDNKQLHTLYIQLLSDLGLLASRSRGVLFPKLVACSALLSSSIFSFSTDSTLFFTSIGLDREEMEEGLCWTDKLVGMI